MLEISKIKPISTLIPTIIVAKQSNIPTIISSMMAQSRFSSAIAKNSSPLTTYGSGMNFRFLLCLPKMTKLTIYR
jgi:hypothetical protein